jgi:DNA-binding GntR family transcriptional regulator
MNKHVIDFPKAASLTESVYGRLRADLLSCRLKPGSKLKVSDLCDELGVSLAVVRESLSRLSAEGLVTSEAQKGFRVPPIASRDLADLTKARIAIEQLCLREAVANATVEWETQIMATHHRMSRSPERDPADPERLSDTYAEAHGAFHEALVAACQNIWLLRMRAQLFTQSERYRRLSVPLQRPLRDLASEHGALLEAALIHDGERLNALMADHLWKTAEILLASGVCDADAGARPVA